MSSVFSHSVSERDATLANWICGSLGLAILTARLASHRWPRCRFDATAYVVIISILVLVARILCNAVVLRDKSIRTADRDSDSPRLASITTRQYLAISSEFPHVLMVE